jgi:MoaA/NifB/PqqE/SkfB family radical SAM enzyme
MKHMADLRREMGSKTRLEWAFVMMKNNLHEMVGAARLAAQYGFERFHAKHMETAINREDLGNALWNTGLVEPPGAEWDAKLEAALDELRQVGRETGLELEIHPRTFVRDGQCIARPANQVFIDYVGNVSSCCYLNKLDVKPYILPEERPKDDGVMGGITLKDFAEILESPRYIEFRRQWLRGEVPESCHSCINLNRMDEGA